MAGHPTILDVARHAGVSVGTVSNVMNDRGNVSAGKRARVAAAMATLGYVPNRVAQALRGGESRVVGLCAPTTTSTYFAALLETFEELAATQGYEIMQVLSRADPALELRRVQALVGRNIDGLILIPTHDSRATFDALAERAVPAVIVDRLARDARFDYVAIDDRKAMREAARHLIGRGHRRLLYLVRDARLSTTQRRIEGFRDAARGVRPPVLGIVLQRDPDEAAFAQQVAAALRGPRAPTAIVASNSAIALSLLRTLQALGVQWPRDVSVLSFDAPDWAAIVQPPLAVVRHPIRAIATAAWNRLLLRLRAPATMPTRITLGAQLEDGPSIGPPPGAA